VSTQIDFLGTLSGTLNFTVYVGQKTGVVGRVQLALDVNGIPAFRSRATSSSNSTPS